MSLPSSVIDAMVAAGCTAEQLGAAVKAANGEAEARSIRKREADAARKRRQRANVTQCHADIDGHNVTDADTADMVSPKKETSPTPPKEKTTPSQSETNVSSKTRATRLPISFEPNLDWAIEAGLSPSQAVIEASQFRDYWIAKPGKDGTKLDWPATWRNWVRTQLKRRPASRASPPRQPSLADAFAAISTEAENRNDPRYRASNEGPRSAIPHLSGVSGR